MHHTRRTPERGLRHFVLQRDDIVRARREKEISDSGRGRQAAQSKNHQRHTIQFEELLWHLGAHTGAQTSSRDDSGDAAHKRVNSLSQSSYIEKGKRSHAFDADGGDLASGALRSAGFRIQRSRRTLAATFACTRRCFAELRSSARSHTRYLLFSTLVVSSEDHFAGRGLVHRSHRDVDRFVDHLARAIYNYHRAVVQIRHALVIFFAFAQDEHTHRLPGQHHRLQGIRQLIHVQNLDALQRCNLVQIEIVGHDFRVVALSKFNQLQVHFWNLQEIVFGDLNLQMRHLLDSLQDFESAPSTLTLQRVGGISHQLQFVQHELRDDHRSIQKLCLGDIRHAPIYNHAGIEHLERVLQAALTTKQSAERLQVQHVTLVRAQDQPYVGHHQECCQTEK